MQHRNSPDQSGWRSRLAVHPAAKRFERMSESDLIELSTDIQLHGLRNKVDVFLTRTFGA